MSKITIFLLFTGCFLFAGSAFAVVPLDADARPQQIRFEYARRTEAYDKRQVERQAEAIRAYEQTRSDLFTPPSKRAQASSGSIQPPSASPEIQIKTSETKPHRFLVSFVLITLLVAIAGWVRYATREIDK